MNGKNETAVKKEIEIENERTDEKNDENKNETLKGRFSSGRQRTAKNRNRLKERPGCPERDRSYP